MATARIRQQRQAQAWQHKTTANPGGTTKGNPRRWYRTRGKAARAARRQETA